MEGTGTAGLLPATGEIRVAFDAEIAGLGGTVADVSDDGGELYLRAVLPAAVEVLPGDPVRGGVALRTDGAAVLVHPYTFRVACANGAIRGQAPEAARVPLARGADGAAALAALAALAAIRGAVRACAQPAALVAGVREMRMAAEREADALLTMLPLLARHHGLQSAPDVARFVSRVLARFRTRPDPDRSAFGLLNAVTSVGRDMRDPAVRWRLEELGGALPARLPRTPRRTPAAALPGVLPSAPDALPGSI